MTGGYRILGLVIMAGPVDGARPRVMPRHCHRTAIVRRAPHDPL
jgi:hypothetical protein